LLQFAIENGPVEIVDLPMKNGQFAIENGPVEIVDLPMKNCQFAIENGHRKSGFTQLKSMVDLSHQFFVNVDPGPGWSHWRRKSLG
jgi:hypothetical protein